MRTELLILQEKPIMGIRDGIQIRLESLSFKCPHCGVILSCPIAMIEGATAGLGVTGLVLKKAAGNTFKLENAGSSKELESSIGKEFTLEQLKSA